MLALFPTVHHSQLQGTSYARSISSLPQFSIVEASQHADIDSQGVTVNIRA
ncbi:hypothetical protein [Streptococcus marmotae]|uniref:hypothetical protein n=1 Tax=Streptococcus marmotae TaxID=1825069 RepID=UPI000A95F2CB|nr:hypothetical protein [Streptococcus marmotae]